MSEHKMNEGIPQVLMVIPFGLALVIYLICVLLLIFRNKRWPIYRIFLWCFGNTAAVLSVFGPLADEAHHRFTAHMLGHLLLGMLAPLLMVLAAPISLILRSLNVNSARRLAMLLKIQIFHYLTDPILASVLNIGGLWIIYTTNFYIVMQHTVILNMLMHIHIFLVGYFFTASFISIDFNPHHTRFSYRSIVLVIALAGHNILAKYIYAHPPHGVPAEQAEAGSILMYYGGDAIDLVLIFLLCLQWYKQTRIHNSSVINSKV